jgi:site-specific recombinase
LIPEIAAFAGIPLEVRHVTLSSGMLAAAMGSLGVAVFSMTEFWLAVIGIAGIGFMNVVVSFTLALMLAIRARGIQSPERRAIYEALWQRLRRQPFSFILPVGTANLSSVPQAEPV